MHSIVRILVGLLLALILLHPKPAQAVTQDIPQPGRDRYIVVGPVNNVSLTIQGRGLARVSAQPFNRAFRVTNAACKVAMFTREGQDTRIVYEQWNAQSNPPPAPALRVTYPGVTTQNPCTPF